MVAGSGSGVPMLIMWKADFDGTDKQLEQVNQKMKELSKKVGYKFDGPYYPQDASLLYLIYGTLEQMNESGRQFIPWAAENEIPITPLRFEVAVTPEEFWGE